MKPLLGFVDRHPLASGAVGSASGFASWIATNAGAIQSVAGMIGAVFGALVAIGTFVIMVPKLWRFARGTRLTWRCRRCGEMVDLETGVCGCSYSPSPWGPDSLP